MASYPSDSAGALIDVGSTSVSLLIASRGARGLVRHRKKKELLRLGAARDDSGCVLESKVGELMGVLRTFREMAEGLPLRVVATASLRGAANLESIQAQVEGAIACPLEVLSGEAEAAAAYRGAHLASPMSGSKLVVDVGGGSTELAWGAGHKPDRVASLSLGVVRLQHEHGLVGAPTQANLRQAEAAVRRSIQGLPPAPGGEAVACSGTMKRLIGVAQKHFPPSLEASLHRSALEGVWESVLSCGEAGPVSLPGADPARSDLLLAGALLFRVLSDELRVQTWRLTPGGLRWGLMDELLSD